MFYIYDSFLENHPIEIGHKIDQFWADTGLLNELFLRVQF